MVLNEPIKALLQMDLFIHSSTTRSAGKRFLFTFSLSKLSMQVVFEGSGSTRVLSCAPAPTTPGTRSRRYICMQPFASALALALALACSSLADAGLEVRSLSCCPSEKNGDRKEGGRRRTTSASSSAACGRSAAASVHQSQHSLRLSSAVRSLRVCAKPWLRSQRDDQHLHPW